MDEDLDILKSMYNKMQNRDEIGRSSLFSDTTSELAWAPNSNIGKKSKSYAATGHTKNMQDGARAKQLQENAEALELISSVFNAEGGYSSDKKDKGNYHNWKTSGTFIGTNHGVSAPVLSAYLGKTASIDEMKALTKEDAATIYKDQYYDKYGVSSLPKDKREIYMHAVVNSGGHGVKVAQGLLGLSADGVVGPNTKKAMESADFTKQEFKNKLLKKYKTFDTWDTHGEGWTDRFEKLAK